MDFSSLRTQVSCQSEEEKESCHWCSEKNW